MMKITKNIHICLLPLVLACGAENTAPATGLEGLSVSGVYPAVIVPGSKLVVEGSSFVTQDWGSASLRVDGGPSIPLEFVDFDRYEALISDELFTSLGEGSQFGSAVLEVISTADGKKYSSAPISLSLDVRSQLDVSLANLTVGALSYINDEVQITGGGILLGGEEGRTYAVVEGCFRKEGSQSCEPIATTEVPVTPESEFNRSSGYFPFAPSIAGIDEGVFEGSVSLRNAHSGGASTASGDSRPMTTELTTSAIFSLGTSEASLGQFVDIEGGGFVGGEDDGLTELKFDGTFTPDRSGEPVNMSFFIVPTYEKGRRVRYVLNEDDMLGQTINLRKITGSFQGRITPIIHYGVQEKEGYGFDFSFRIAPIKQVVYLDFYPSYKATLPIFGLRAMESEIRKRIMTVVTRDYEGINVEFRTEKPTDFSESYYATVDMAGMNPNWRAANTSATLGLDNTTGKDVGNERLHDHLGVSNSCDGENSCGGVFVQALFGFSQHPGDVAKSVPQVATPLFDEIFDPFRPDQGGAPINSGDFLSGTFEPITSGDSCPASDRKGQIQCAVWTLGNLVGTTLTHEVGHSLGLANPFGSGFHLSSDDINRIMDNGGDRPFNERAELMGEGPGQFCQSHYEYLQDILPTGEDVPAGDRPSCF
jgi:hypothetical protein